MSYHSLNPLFEMKEYAARKLSFKFRGNTRRLQALFSAVSLLCTPSLDSAQAREPAERQMGVFQPPLQYIPNAG
jgi:hypothetical protein